jgi:hypothetical protein
MTRAPAKCSFGGFSAKHGFVLTLMNGYSENENKK